MKKIIAILILAGMSVYATLSTTYEPVSYNANGVTTAFPFPYTFFATTDLIVYYVDSDGVSTILTEGSGAGKYTVSAANNDYSNGATVTTGTTYSDGKIVIERSVPYGQQLSINGDFIPAKPLEQQLDKLAAQTQQVKDEIGRTLTIPVTDDSSLTTEFPNAETRANKAAYFDASGNATVVSLVDSGTVAADEQTITQSTGGVLSVKNDGIDTAQIADYAVENSQLGTNAVHSINILDGDVTTADLDDDAVTTVKVTDEAITFAKLNSGNISTNVSTTSQTNLVTEGGIKAYVDTTASDIAMQYSGTQVFSGTTPTSWTDLDISSVVGANRAFVHLRFVSASNVTVDFRTNGETDDTANYGTTRIDTDGAGADLGYVSLITDASGVIEWDGNAGVSATVDVLCYQVLQ